MTTVGREEVPALLAAGVAAGEHLGAGRDRRLDLVDDLLPLRRRDHRADVGADLHRVAEHEALGVGDEGGDVVVVDLAGDVEALRRGADLPGVQERGPGAAAGGDLDLGGDVGADDEGVLAAHLEVDPGEPLGAGERDAPAGRRPSR